AEKLSFKKSVVAGERDRPDVARRRARWIKYQDRVEPERLVFIDETWTRTDMAPLRGWAPRGCRLTTKVPLPLCLRSYEMKKERQRLGPAPLCRRGRA